MPNFRRYARGRPHSLQRLCLRVENLGFRASLTRFAVVAIQSLCVFETCVFLTMKPGNLESYVRNGIPMCFNNVRA